MAAVQTRSSGSRFGGFDGLVADLREGCQNLLAHKTFAATVIVTLALGIGANTAIFSVLNAVVLQPLPYSAPEELVEIQASMPRAGVELAPFSVPEIMDLRAQTGALSSLAEMHVMYFILLGRDEPERVSTGVVSANYFQTLGVQPLLGRDFRPEDDVPGAPAVLLLSFEYWQLGFGGDPDVVGRGFQMNGRAHTVIGVMPPIPDYPEPVSVYMPTVACPFRSNPDTEQSRTARFISAIGRLDQGVPAERLGTDLDVVANRLQQSDAAAYPARAGYALSAMGMQDELTREFRPTLLILVGTGAFLLLVLGSSIIALLLARVVYQERDVTMRSVFGATRAGLLRLFVAENAILAGLGALGGLLVAYQSLGLLRSLAGRFTTRASEIGIDGPVLGFLVVLAGVISLVFGSVSALSSRARPAAVLGNTGTRSVTMRRPVLSALVVVQIAVSFALLTGAGLMIRTVVNLQNVDTGLRTDVLTMRVALDFLRYPTPVNWSGMYQRLLDEAEQIPGIESVSAASTVPLNEGTALANVPLLVEGRETDDGTPLPQITTTIISPGYLETVGRTLRQGRAFSRADDLEAPAVVLVNESAARRYWDGEDPVGRRVRFNPDQEWMTVVGVVSDARQRLDAEPADEVFRPIFQQPLPEVRFFVRSATASGTLQRQLRDAVRRVDATQPIESFQTLEDVRQGALASPRLTATLLAAFGVIALVISAIGIAGVVGFSVSQRTREFGTLMALGFDGRSILGLVLREGAVLVAAGLTLGVFGALLLTRQMETLLFSVASYDVMTYVGVGVVLAAVTLAGVIVPARLAATVDPMVALRAD